MKLSLDLRATLTQTLTPQQIQYLKLLQLPLVQLEQHVQQEIEENPMLDDAQGEDDELFGELAGPTDSSEPPEFAGDFVDEPDKTKEEKPSELIDDTIDPFEFHKLIWDEGTEYQTKSKSSQGSDEGEGFQIKDSLSFIDELMQQLRMLELSREEVFLGEIIIGNIDNDGYLRRDLEEIVQETNEAIAEYNYEVKKTSLVGKSNGNSALNENPARSYLLSSESAAALGKVYAANPELLENLSDESQKELSKYHGNGNSAVLSEKLLDNVDVKMAERVLGFIRSLDPPGIGSRNIRECLLAQCKAVPKPNAARKLAIKVLEEAYEPFIKKHYHLIIKQLGISEDYLREAIEVIRRLNPNPGGGNFQPEMNTVIPDFSIFRDEDSDDLMISVNDSLLPVLHLNKAYEKLKKETAYKKFNKDTRDWVRNKYEDAKFLIQAIKQRKSTMLKVMTAIAELQREFFYKGESALRPLIYKNVAEETGLDISTICRIVNHKYVQTEFGTYDLKFFFSEALPSNDGEEIATRVIKQKLKEIIGKEPKNKPYSDDKLSALLKEAGYRVARRTVAKYREQMKIPVARLRKEL